MDNSQGILYRAIVAPFTGAWIEIYLSPLLILYVILSHPSRVRGLKCITTQLLVHLIRVAPFTGAWIEIDEGLAAAGRKHRRTLHGCVD